MGSFREKTSRFEARLNSFEKWFMIFLTSALTVVTFLQVFTRYVLQNPFFWTEEMARFLFIWVCMIGIAMGVGEKAHYGFETVFRLFPRAIQFLCTLVVYVVIGLFAVVLTFKGLQELPFTANQMASSLPVTMLWSYIALPVGGILMLIHHILRFILEGPWTRQSHSDWQG